MNRPDMKRIRSSCVSVIENDMADWISELEDALVKMGEFTDSERGTSPCGCDTVISGKHYADCIIGKIIEGRRGE